MDRLKEKGEGKVNEYCLFFVDCCLHDSYRVSGILTRPALSYLGETSLFIDCRTLFLCQFQFEIIYFSKYNVTL